VSALLRFYSGDGPDDRGRTLAEIQAWDDARLEMVHDFVQWLFPLPEPSAFNAAAPLLTEQDIAAFRADPALRDALQDSFARMLQFYGFDFDADTPAVAFAPEGAGQRRAWLTPGNHNFLRISRILRSLHLLGLGELGHAFLAALLELAGSPEGRAIPATTLAYWRDAAGTSGP
jgi:hypothetical protein